MLFGFRIVSVRLISSIAVKMVAMKLVLLFLLSCHVMFFSQAQASHAHLKMFHVRSKVTTNTTANVTTVYGLENMQQLLQRDEARLSLMAHHVDTRRKAMEMTSSPGRYLPLGLPMRSAADTGLGQYMVSVRIGTPHPQRFILLADTGSDLTWVNCKYSCKVCPENEPQPDRYLFDANRSPSFKPISCSSKTCLDDLSQTFSLKRCPEEDAPCLYDYKYIDGTKVLGLFANETISMCLKSRKKVKMHNILIGCTQSNSGNTLQSIDGIMGLGYSKYSFAVSVAKQFGNKFSYCLVDHLSPSNIVSSLTFGKDAKLISPKLTYTDLLLDQVTPYYGVNISGISINGKMLNISPRIWDMKGEGGAILDSGSSLTYFATPAYKVVLEAFNASLSKFNPRKVPELDQLDLCFEEKGYNESLVPRMVIHFGNGVDFVPPLKSYIIDAEEGIKCLGIASCEWPGVSVLGNIMQQNHIWEFDLGTKKLGFAAASCSNPKQNKGLH